MCEARSGLYNVRQGRKDICGVIKTFDNRQSVESDSSCVKIDLVEDIVSSLTSFALALSVTGKRASCALPTHPFAIVQ